VEARTAYRGSGISKSFVAVMAVVATVGLGVTAGVVAKNLSAPAAPKAHISQGLGGAAQENPAYRSGVQIVGGNAASTISKAVGPDDRATTTQLAPNSFLGPDAQDRNNQLAASMRTTKAHGYI
jgi:hypothetical protein